MNKELNKIAIGAILASLSVIFRYTFENIMPANFNLPFYGIPLILAGLFLGKRYGVLVAIVADTAIGLLSPWGYLPGFVFSSLAWGLLPALIMKEPKGYKWYFVIAITYLIASLANTGALWFYYSKGFAFANFFLRLGLIIPFSLIISYLTYQVYNRTRYTLLTSK